MNLATKGEPIVAVGADRRCESLSASHGCGSGEALRPANGQQHGKPGEQRGGSRTKAQALWVLDASQS